MQQLLRHMNDACSLYIRPKITIIVRAAWKTGQAREEAVEGIMPGLHATYFRHKHTFLSNYP
jgi:hypothetical protein